MEAEEKPVLAPPVEVLEPAEPDALIPNAGPGDHAVVLEGDDDALHEVVRKSSKFSKSSRSRPV